MATVITEGEGEREVRRVEAHEEGRSKQSVEDFLAKDRSRFVWFFMWVIGAVLAFVAVMIGSMVLIVFKQGEPAEKTLFIEVIQIGLAMIFGFASISFGVAITWVGITSQSSLNVGDKGQHQGGTAQGGVVPRIALTSAGPGLFLFLGGLVLIGVSLYKPISKYEHSEHYSTDIPQPSGGP
jgi:hypothetical protein